MKKICLECLMQRDEKEFTNWESGICDNCLLEKFYKQNVIQLARDHKRVCNHSDCNVSLILLLEMAQKVGIKFTDEEIKIFI